jgi:hypothetical protein
MGRAGLLLVAVGLTVCSGCGPLRALAYYLSPERQQDAQFELTRNALAIVVDGAPGADDHPLFRQALHDQLADLLGEHKVNDRVVPYVRQLELQQQHADYRRWSIQRIGRELGAEQVVYLRIETFSLRDTPDYPVLTPRAKVRVKVIDANSPVGDARLWPEDSAGFPIECSRQAGEATDVAQTDLAATKLGKDTAQFVGRLFFKHVVDEPIPREK